MYTEPRRAIKNPNLSFQIARSYAKNLVANNIVNELKKMREWQPEMVLPRLPSCQQMLLLACFLGCLLSLPGDSRSGKNLFADV